MAYYFRFAVCWIMVLSMGACSQSGQPQHGLPELPDNILERTSSEQAALLDKIAVFSYRTFLDVPEKGLFSQRNALEDIISARNWLAARGHPLFQLLALRLTEGADRAIWNEVSRMENSRHGFRIYTPFKKGSFDIDLVQNLLHLNKFSERGYLEYAIALDGDMAESLRRRKHTYNDYADGSVFRGLSPEMQKRLKGMRLMIPLFTGRMSERRAADFVLMQTLLGIDRVEDIRMLMRIYVKQGGFPNDLGKLRQFITAELATAKRKIRFASGYLNTNIAPLHTADFYAETEPLSYEYALTILFYPFIMELEVIHDKYRGIIPADLKNGQWLSLENR